LKFVLTLMGREIKFVVKETALNTTLNIKTGA